MDRVVARAYAKLTLGLEVIGKRTDGLHEVATVLQTIDLFDRIECRWSEGISLSCAEMAVGPDNLILQAAHLLKEKASVQEGAEIVCAKRIPVGAGLGGGSADAAATLRALVALWGVRIDQGSLLELAGSLGADVPFCLVGGTALATGIGRNLERLPDPPFHWVVLVPIDAPEGHKTAEMYARLTSADFSAGSAAAHQADAIRHGRLDCARVFSPFTRPAIERWPAAALALDLLTGSRALAVSVAGAGPSAYGLFRSLRDAGAAVRALGERGIPAQLRRFVGPVNLVPPRTGEREG